LHPKTLFEYEKKDWTGDAEFVQVGSSGIGSPQTEVKLEDLQGHDLFHSIILEVRKECCSVLISFS